MEYLTGKEVRTDTELNKLITYLIFHQGKPFSLDDIFKQLIPCLKESPYENSPEYTLRNHCKTMLEDLSSMKTLIVIDSTHYESSFGHV